MNAYTQWEKMCKDLLILSIALIVTVIWLIVVLVDQKQENRILQNKLTATVEACGDAWLKTPITEKEIGGFHE
jgi:hypothetical protein